MLARFCTAPRRGGHHHLMTAPFEQAMLLTPPQMDSPLRDVVTKHLRKLKRLSSAAKLYPNLTLRVPNPTMGAAWTFGSPCARTLRRCSTDQRNTYVCGQYVRLVYCGGSGSFGVSAQQLIGVDPTWHLAKFACRYGAPANASHFALAQTSIFVESGWRLRSLNYARGQNRRGVVIFVDQILKDRFDLCGKSWRYLSFAPRSKPQYMCRSRFRPARAHCRSGTPVRDCPSQQ